MRILLVAHLKRKVAPGQTAARSRVIYELARGLRERGHEVTLLGTGDSKISGVKIIPAVPKELVSSSYENEFYAHTSYLAQLTLKLRQVAHDYDVVHNHVYPEFFPLSALEHLHVPLVTTIHAQATPELDAGLGLYPSARLVAISKAHKKGFKKAKVKHVAYNGVDTKLFRYQEKKGDYLLWIGRLGRAKDKNGQFVDAKGVRWAIELARKTGSKLKLSGNVEDIDFYNTDVKPYLNRKIKWIGGVSPEPPLSKREVAELMGGAKAYLMTINWEEPFGLVMAEAGATGTPVIGFDRGSVAEIVQDGKTGFVVSPRAGVRGLEQALSRISEIDSSRCREYVLRHFSTSQMVERYEKIYNTFSH